MILGLIEYKYSWRYYKILDSSGFNLNKKFIITPEKPAVSILNEISPNLQYDVQEVKVEGSKALPTFTCTITFPVKDLKRKILTKCIENSLINITYRYT